MSDQQKVDYNRALIAYQKGDYSRTVELLSSHEWQRHEPILLYVTALRRLGRNSEAEAILRELKSH